MRRSGRPWCSDRAQDRRELTNDAAQNAYLAKVRSGEVFLPFVWGTVRVLYTGISMVLIRPPPPFGPGNTTSDDESKRWRFPPVCFVLLRACHLLEEKRRRSRALAEFHLWRLQGRRWVTNTLTPQTRRVRDLREIRAKWPRSTTRFPEKGGRSLALSSSQTRAGTTLNGDKRKNATAAPPKTRTPSKDKPA